MLLTEIRDLIVTEAWEMKEKACRRGPKDIRPVIDVFRGGEPVATIMPVRQSPSLIVNTYGMAVTGFDADQSSWVMESFTTGPNMDAGVNPLTGEPPGSTTLSELFYEHDGYAKGWVSEAIFIGVANKAGDVLVANLPYHYTSGGYLMWDKPWLSPENEPGHMDGAMGNPMVVAMNDAPSFSQVFPGLATDDISRAELDIVVLSVIQSQVDCRALLWAHRGGVRERTIRQEMQRR